MLNISHDSANEFQVIEEFVLRNDDVFALSDEELDVLNIASILPIHQPPYRTPFSQREKIAGLIAYMEKRGIVQPSFSP